MSKIKVLSLFFIVLLLFSLTACNDNDSGEAKSYDQSYYGTYVDSTGSKIIINKDSLQWGSSLYEYSISDNLITAKGSFAGGRTTWPFQLFENDEIISAGVILDFDNGSFVSRNGKINVSLTNYTSSLSIADIYSFNNDGTFSYINTNYLSLNCSGNYTLKNGLLIMNGSFLSGKSYKDYWYITNSYTIHQGVYIKNISQFIPIAKEEVSSDTSKESENIPDFAGGNGTKKDPYKISTLAQLENMEKFPEATYILTNDIELPVTHGTIPNFSPLFSYESMFNGTLDGQGFSIKNVSIISTGLYTGLFACLGNNSNISNVKILNAHISGSYYLGILAGISNGSINNIETQGSIVLSSKSTYADFIGGIVGSSDSSSISSCYSICEITINSDYSACAGGLVGYAKGGTTITNSCNTGSINGSPYAGGLVGYANGGTTTITNSCNTGSINGSSYAGGLVGYANGGTTITNSYNAGDIISNDNAGGLVGHAYATTTITNSYNAGDIISNDNAGGLVGYAKGGTTITNSYNAGSINGNSCAGGLVGYDFYTTTIITNSYNTNIKKEEGVTILPSITEIVDILQEVWDTEVWHFENKDSLENPTLKIE